MGDFRRGVTGPLEDAGASVRERRRIRSGAYDGPTAGLAAGHVQANLVVLPRALAGDFLRFAQANPKPCPLLDVSEPGDPRLPRLGVDLDIRTDLPRYRVWQHGELVDEPRSIADIWRDDLVSFAIGCSFSFEEALLEDGIALRHLTLKRNVAMYRTNVPCVSAGAFEGPLVVSMRPLTPAAAIRAIQITSHYPAVHGAPVHLGNPALIGIDDLSKPDYGDAVPVLDGELPVFWACGVTPQAAIARVKPDFCVTHAPGSMLVTDLWNADLATCEFRVDRRT
ncbi:MAG TPA: putative hydro-lyase [Rhodanobacteraceae bacterium]